MNQPNQHERPEPEPLMPSVEADPTNDRITLEAPSHDPPMVYVASLSDYTNGILHGRWVDMTNELDEIDSQVSEMLEHSPTAEQYGEPAEEMAIHDYSGFGAWAPGEHSRLSTIHEVAQAMTEHGEAVTAWIAYLGEDPAVAIRSFLDAYEGHWERIEDYAQHLLDEYGLTITVDPLSWEGYVSFNIDAFVRDLSIEMYVHERDDGSIDVFNPHA